MRQIEETGTIVARNYINATSGMLVEKLGLLMQDSMIEDTKIEAEHFKPGYEKIMDEALELKNQFGQDEYTSTFATEKSEVQE